MDATAQQFYDQAFAKATESGAVVASSLRTVDRVLPFSNFAIDSLLLGVGGIPVGRIAELWGGPSGGKSTNSARATASAQRCDKLRLGAWIDTEASMQDAFGLSWAERQGVDLDRLFIYDCQTLEDTLEAAAKCIFSGDYSIVVIDSLTEAAPAALSAEYEPIVETTDDGEKKRKRKKTNAEKKGWGGKRTVGEEPKAISEWVKTVCAKAHRNDCTVVIVTQVMVMIGQRSYRGPVLQSPGGYRLHHTASLRILMDNTGDIKRRISTGPNTAWKVVGAELGSKVVKCKFVPHGAETGVSTPGPIRLLFNSEDPLDECLDILYAADQCDILTTSGNWVEWPEEGIKVNGKEAFVERVTRSGLLPILREEAAAAMKERAVTFIRKRQEQVEEEVL